MCGKEFLCHGVVPKQIRISEGLLEDIRHEIKWMSNEIGVDNRRILNKIGELLDDR